MKSLWSELNELKRENAELKDTIEKCWEAICEADDGEFTLPQRIDSLYTSYLELSDKEYLRLVILHHIVEDNTDTMAKLRDIVFKAENDCFENGCFDQSYQAKINKKGEQNAK